MSEKNIKDFSLVELKALVYDHILSIQNLEASMKRINEEIASRSVVKPEDSKI